MNDNNSIEQKPDVSRLLTPLFFPMVLWIVHLVSLLFNEDLSKLGLLPRNLAGLLGIITSPLIHADFAHLISNTIPLIILGWIIFTFYRKVSYLLLYLFI